MIRFDLTHETHVVEMIEDALRLDYVRVGVWWTRDTRLKPPLWPAPGLLCVGYLQAHPRHHASPQRILYLDSRVPNEGTTAALDASVTIADPQSIEAKKASFARPTTRTTGTRPGYFGTFEHALEQARSAAHNWARHFGLNLEPYQVETWPRQFMGLNLTGHL